MTANNEGNIDKREEELQKRLDRIKEIELELLQKEKQIKEKEKSKKQILLRLSPTLWNDLAAWAEDDYRSINGQIEFLLSECVRKRKQN